MNEYIFIQNIPQAFSLGCREKAEGEEIFLAGRKIFWFWEIYTNESVTPGGRFARPHLGEASLSHSVRPRSDLFQNPRF